MAKESMKKRVPRVNVKANFPGKRTICEGRAPEKSAEEGHWRAGDARRQRGIQTVGSPTKKASRKKNADMNSPPTKPLNRSALEHRWVSVA
jgi:hypothetical protein